MIQILSSYLQSLDLKLQPVERNNTVSVCLVERDLTARRYWWMSKARACVSGKKTQHNLVQASLLLNHTFWGLNQAVPYESAVPLWFTAADLDLKRPSLPLKLSDWLPDAASSHLLSFV